MSDSSLDPPLIAGAEDFREIDLNPVIAYTDGHGIVAPDALLVTA